MRLRFVPLLAVVLAAFGGQPCTAQVGVTDRADSSAWKPGAHWRYVSQDGRFDLDVFVLRQAEHAERGTVQVVAIRERNGRSARVYLTCFTIAREALEPTLTELVGVADVREFDYCVGEPWSTQWAQGNVKIFDSIADAQDFGADVCRRTRTGPCEENR